MPKQNLSVIVLQFRGDRDAMECSIDVGSPQQQDDGITYPFSVRSATSLGALHNATWLAGSRIGHDQLFNTDGDLIAIDVESVRILAAGILEKSAQPSEN